MGDVPLVCSSTSNFRQASVLSNTIRSERIRRSATPPENPDCWNLGVDSAGRNVDIVGLVISRGK